MLTWPPATGPPAVGMPGPQAPVNPAGLVLFHQFQLYLTDWQRTYPGVPPPTLQDYILIHSATTQSVAQPPIPTIQPELELVSEVEQLKAAVEELWKRGHEESITAARGEKGADDGNDGDDEDDTFRPTRKRRKQDKQQDQILSVGKARTALTEEQQRARYELRVCG